MWRLSAALILMSPACGNQEGIGHGSEEMVNRYTHLRPDFTQTELERVPDFVLNGTKNAKFDPVDPQAGVAA